jgi:dipeptidyl aminopeptidase/acylaminoacyl peptidase
MLTALSIGVGVMVTQEGGRIPLRADQLAAAAGIYDFTWSPDGRSIAYISMQSGNSEIWIVPASGGNPRRLTSTFVLKKQPRWSPDGKSIAFVEVPDSGSADVSLVDIEDGATTNLTENINDSRNPVWAPDSKRIAYVEKTAGRTRLVVLDLESRQARPLVDAAVSQLTWSPDGNSLAYVANPLLGNDDRRENQDIFIISVSGGPPRLLTPGTPRFRDFSPSWAPDSRQIAYVSDSSGYDNIYIQNVATGAKKSLVVGTIDHAQPRWSPDGANIAYVRDENNRSTIWLAAVQGGRVTRVSDHDGINGGYDSPDAGPLGKLEWSPDSKRIAFTHSEPARTSDLWVGTPDGSRSIQLTNSMPQELRREARFIAPEVTSYRSFDGVDVSALVYKPRSLKPKSGYPTVLVFREAIDGQHSIGWDPFVQLLVSEGYLVFAPNIRGSGGRGRGYRELVYEHGGDHDVRDAYIGLDRLSSDGLVDTQRVGVLGAGTGGFLTTAALIKDETRFKAAVCLYGIIDAVSAASYPSSEAWTRYLIGESPMTAPFPFYERSLVNFVDKLRTPIIFLYTNNDPRAPFQQLQQFAVQAEVKGKWFDYRIFNSESESWLTWHPASMRQTLEAVEALFEKHLLGREREIRLTRNR